MRKISNLLLIKVAAVVFLFSISTAALGQCSYSYYTCSRCQVLEQFMGVVIWGDAQSGNCLSSEAHCSMWTSGFGTMAISLLNGGSCNAYLNGPHHPNNATTLVAHFQYQIQVAPFGGGNPYFSWTSEMRNKFIIGDLAAHCCL